MAQVVVTFRIMPDSPDIDLKIIETKAKKLIASVGEVGKVEVQPVAFGLNALLIFFVMDESKGSTDQLEKRIAAIEGVTSIEVVDVRRAIG
ncbi:MAG: elongation factor 1-beta [Candidatus Woesearchaeota archaeon]